MHNPKIGKLATHNKRKGNILIFLFKSAYNPTISNKIHIQKKETNNKQLIF